MSQNDPQNGGRKNGPPDLDEVFRGLSDKLGRFFGGGNGERRPPSDGGSGFAATSGAVAIVGVIAVLWAASGFYVVDERENAVIMRFGRHVDTVAKPGLHWRLPRPIENNLTVNVTELRSLKVGVRGASTAADESTMLTGDQNIIEVQLEVQYNFKSASDFVFKNVSQFKDGDDLVKQAAESAIREVMGRNKVDYVLNEGRGKISEDTKELIQNLLDRYETGVAVSRVNISDVQPPEQVQAAFADAVQARQDKARLINEGTAYANDVIPKASGAAARLVQEAEGYRQQVVARAEGDASRFKQVYAEYSKAPQVTRDRMYLDAMQQMYQNTTKVLVDQKSGGNLLYLPFDKLLQQTAAQSATASEPVVTRLPEPVRIEPANTGRMGR